PGLFLKTFLLAVNGEAYVLHAPAEGGDLEIPLTMNPQEIEEQRLALVVLQDGLPISTPTLFRWAAGWGVPFEDAKGFHIPHLATGTYEVCLGPQAILDAAEFPVWRAAKAACAGPTFLANGATLRLQIKAPTDAGWPEH